MTIVLRWMALAVLVAGAAACSDGAQALPQPVLPPRILPPVIEGFDVREETAAAKAFRTSYDVSLVADGKVFTLRKGGEVQASLQISVLKRQYNTRKEAVRRGIRGSIEKQDYRWFKVMDQWVGEQRLEEIALYLWMPPGGTLFEVLVVKPELGIPKQLLSSIITYQRGSS